MTERVVFARMSPEHKVQVVQTLERVGLVCAMVGDGANDAAAIRAATVGVGVASRGSDPARLAADVMLLDGRIEALLDALDEGRQLWRRVQAAVAVLLGGNAGEVTFAIVGSALTGRAPLNTRQLLLVNMLTDALPAAALAVSPPSARMRSAGRGPDQAALWRTVAVRGGATAAAATGAWIAASLTGRPQRASTVGLVALVAAQLGQTLLDSHSPLVVLTAAGSMTALAGAVMTPGLSQLLGCTPLGPVGWTQALGSAAVATAGAALVPVITERLVHRTVAGLRRSACARGEAAGRHRSVVDLHDTRTPQDRVQLAQRHGQQPGNRTGQRVRVGASRRFRHTVEHDHFARPAAEEAMTRRQRMADQSPRTASHRTAVDRIREAESFAVQLPIVGRVRIPRPDQLAYYAGWQRWPRSSSSTGRSR